MNTYDVINADDVRIATVVSDLPNAYELALALYPTRHIMIAGDVVSVANDHVDDINNARSVLVMLDLSADVAASLDDDTDFDALETSNYVIVALA